MSAPSPRRVQPCPPDHRHADALTCYYDHFCSCQPCRDHALARARARYRAHVDGTWVDPLIPAIGTHRRIQALQYAGWSLQMQGDTLGVSMQNLQSILKRPRVGRAVADHVAQMYSALWDQTPPGRNPGERSARSRTRLNARRRGFAGALAWDDDTIDDPDATPEGIATGPESVSSSDVDDIAVDLAVSGQKVRLTPAERRIVVRIMHARVMSDSRIANYADCDTRTVTRIRDELGLPGWSMRELEEAA